MPGMWSPTHTGPLNDPNTPTATTILLHYFQFPVFIPPSPLPLLVVDPIFPFCCGPDFENQWDLVRHQAFGPEVWDVPIRVALFTPVQHLTSAPQRVPKCDLALTEQWHQQRLHLPAPFVKREDDHNYSDDWIWPGGWGQPSDLLFSHAESDWSLSVGSGIGDPPLQLLFPIWPQLLGGLAEPSTGFFFIQRLAAFVVVDRVYRLSGEFHSPLTGGNQRRKNNFWKRLKQFHLSNFLNCHTWPKGKTIVHKECGQ